MLCIAACSDWCCLVWNSQSCHVCCAAVQSVYLGLLTDRNMELLFRIVLEKLKVSLEGDELPAHVRLFLHYIPGVPRQLQLIYAAVAQSQDGQEFQKSKLLLGLRLTKEHPERYCWLPCVHCAKSVLVLCPSAHCHHPARSFFDAYRLTKADIDSLLCCYRIAGA